MLEIQSRHHLRNNHYACATDADSNGLLPGSKDKERTVDFLSGDSTLIESPSSDSSPAEVLDDSDGEVFVAANAFCFLRLCAIRAECESAFDRSTQCCPFAGVRGDTKWNVLCDILLS